MSKAKLKSYGLSESTLRGLIKNKAQHVEKFKSCSVESVKRKRDRDGQWPGFEKGVTLWISSKNVKGSLPSMDIILAKAKIVSHSNGTGF